MLLLLRALLKGAAAEAAGFFGKLDAAGLAAVAAGVALAAMARMESTNTWSALYMFCFSEWCNLCLLQLLFGFMV